MVSRPGSEQAVGGGCLSKPGSFLFRIVAGQPVLVAAQVCTGLLPPGAPNPDPAPAATACFCPQAGHVPVSPKDPILTRSLEVL